MIISYWGSAYFSISAGDWEFILQPISRRLKPFGKRPKVHSATVIPRMPINIAPHRAAAFIALATAACLVLAACSPGADYPSLFPSVHDVPPPRADTTLDSNQVQRATEDLISARDRLSAEAQDKNSTKPTAKPSGKPAAGPTAAGKQSTTPVSARQTPGTDAERTAGTETKR